MLEQTQGFLDGAHFAEQVIAHLAHAAMPLEQEYTFDFFLYLATERAAGACVKRLCENNIDVELKAPDTTESQWLCIGTKSLTANQQKLQEIGEVFLSLAEHYQGDFDGWEVSSTESSAQYIELQQLLDVDSIAQGIVDSVRQHYPEQHHYEQCHYRDFPHLTKDFYLQMEQEWSALNFTKLADIEDKTASQLSQTLSMIRVMQDADKATICLISEVVSSYSQKIVTLQSFFADGHVITTTTDLAVTHPCEFQMHLTQYCSQHISMIELYKKHQQQLSTFLSNHSDIAFETIDDISRTIELNNRVHQYQNQQLRNIGWATYDYVLERCAGDEEIARSVVAAVEKMELDG